MIFLRPFISGAGKGRHGFTLIEMLLGINLLALIMVCAFTTYSAGTKMHQRARAYTHLYREVYLTLETLARELENMRPYDFSRSYPRQKAFQGTRDRLTFLTGSAQGLRVVSYYLVEAEVTRLHEILVKQKQSRNVTVTSGSVTARREKYLVREERAWLDYLMSDTLQPDKAVVLCTGIQAGGLRFFYASRSRGSPDKWQWGRTWDQDTLPGMVKIEIDQEARASSQTVGRAETEKLKTLTREVLIPASDGKRERKQK